MRFSINFYRAAAVCSVITAVTTLMLIFLPGFFAPGQPSRSPSFSWPREHRF
jgi:hypothetical protein